MQAPWDEAQVGRHTMADPFSPPLSYLLFFPAGR
jgi:hypothetical protein